MRKRKRGQNKNYKHDRVRLLKLSQIVTWTGEIQSMQSRQLQECFLGLEKISDKPNRNQIEFV